MSSFSNVVMSSAEGRDGTIYVAGTFTNVVRTYGLQSGLAPAVIAEVSDWSDHYSFTSQGFPAICGIEEDVDDFNPYYHTVNDTLARLNMAYATYIMEKSTKPANVLTDLSNSTLLNLSSGKANIGDYDIGYADPSGTAPNQTVLLTLYAKGGTTSLKTKSIPWPN